MGNKTNSPTEIMSNSFAVTSEPCCDSQSHTPKHISPLIWKGTDWSGSLAHVLTEKLNFSKHMLYQLDE